MAKVKWDVQAQINIFGPWHIWPFAGYSARNLEESPGSRITRHVETFFFRPLFFALQIQRTTDTERVQ